MDIKNQYPDCIVLFRMGDFFETFNEDAKITAKILGIVLTKRASGAAAQVPLAGFPHHALDNYLPKLVAAGHRVAICEQVEDPKLAKGIVKREVVEVVTPGTISSDQAISQKSNRYLACLYFHRDEAGYAFLDQSTGEFYIGQCANERLTEELRKFTPSEVLIGESVTYSLADWYQELKPFVTTVEDWLFNFDQSYRALTDHFRTPTLKGFGCQDLVHGITAGGVVFYHIHNSLNGSLEHVSKIRPIIDDKIMGLDHYTVRNLEVFNSLSTQGTHGTLIDLMDLTVTAGGGRLLRQWLNRPLTDKNRLTARLNSVSAFKKHKSIMTSVRNRLKSLADIERIIGKINRGKVAPREIFALGKNLNNIPDFISDCDRSKEESLIDITNQFRDVEVVTDRIIATINEDTPAQLKNGNVIASGIDEDLDELRKLAGGGKQWIKELQDHERKETGISSLKVSFNRVFGYYIEITNTHQDKVPPDYIRKQTLVNSERYITQDLKDQEEKILAAESQIEEIESRLFNDLCRFVLSKADAIQTNAMIFNRLDVITSFSVLAVNNNYCRPRFSEKHVIKIVEGRHPVVERLLPATERFIPNDLTIDSNQNQIQLITGPNMAGKSTYLRQIGLIVHMSQIGSFVPAKSAIIGIVDKLFTRVGASDNLAGGESTFLVEMIEAANILNNATNKSLILLDEIGRGTATYDGLSLAWSITEYLHEHKEVAARTLFATHFHELTVLENTLERLENHYTAVEEFGDKIVFLRKVLKGVADKSYGIHVAKMAGLPESVLNRAAEILNSYLSREKSEDEINRKTTPFLRSKDQLSLFEVQENRLKQALSKIKVNEMTPMEALQKLDELKKEHGL
jgi:DNA mismatch repair protein MutS